MRRTGGASWRVQEWVGNALDRLEWVPTTLTIALPVVAATLFVFKGDLKHWQDWLFLGLGILVLVLHALVQWTVNWWRAQNEAAEVHEANRLRVAMKDALQPVAELIASMPYEKKPDRISLLKAVATQAVSAIILLMKDVDRARAVVYAMDPSQTSMTELAHHGRGSRPSPFTAGNQRGDRALALVQSQGELFVEDLDKAKPDEWEGSGSDYRTFISAAISNGEYAYGMVTLDAPSAGDLGENDKHIMLLIADLLAIAFAEADR